METIRRKTIQINLIRVPLQLKELTSRIPENSSFSERHGRLISLVNTNIEEEMVKVLFQFFDPLHHCFTFPDYQLVPTLEEFSQLLKIPILNQLPYNGTEKEPKLEEVAKALCLQPSDIKGHCQGPSYTQHLGTPHVTRGQSKGYHVNSTICISQLFLTRARKVNQAWFSGPRMLQTNLHNWVNNPSCLYFSPSFFFYFLFVLI